MEFSKDTLLHRCIVQGEHRVMPIWTKYKEDFTSLPHCFAGLGGLHVTDPTIMFKIVRMCATDEHIEKMISIRAM